jgi:hypothetical protein
VQVTESTIAGPAKPDNDPSHSEIDWPRSGMMDTCRYFGGCRSGRTQMNHQPGSRKGGISLNFLNSSWGDGLALDDSRGHFQILWIDGEIGDGILLGRSAQSPTGSHWGNELSSLRITLLVQSALRLTRGREVGARSVVWTPIEHFHSESCWTC